MKIQGKIKSKRTQKDINYDKMKLLPQSEHQVCEYIKAILAIARIVDEEVGAEYEDINEGNESEEENCLRAFDELGVPHELN